MASILESLRPLIERKGIDGQSEMTLSTIWDKVKTVILTVWSKTTRRMRMIGGLAIFL